MKLQWFDQFLREVAVEYREPENVNKSWCCALLLTVCGEEVSVNVNTTADDRAAPQDHFFQGNLW